MSTKAEDVYNLGYDLYARGTSDPNRSQNIAAAQVMALASIAIAFDRMADVMEKQFEYIEEERRS